MSLKRRQNSETSNVSTAGHNNFGQTTSTSPIHQIQPLRLSSFMAAHSTTNIVLEIALPAVSPTDTAQSSDESVLRGAAFTVNAVKSTFKMMTIGSNVYQVWFKEMEDVEPMIIEDVTKGLVCRTYLMVFFVH